MLGPNVWLFRKLMGRFKHDFCQIVYVSFPIIMKKYNSNLPPPRCGQSCRFIIWKACTKRTDERHPIMCFSISYEKKCLFNLYDYCFNKVVDKKLGFIVCSSWKVKYFHWNILGKIKTIIIQLFSKTLLTF